MQQHNAIRNNRSKRQPERENYIERLLRVNERREKLQLKGPGRHKKKPMHDSVVLMKSGLN